MRIPDLPWLLRKMEQDEALDKLEDAIGDEAMRELLTAQSELWIRRNLSSTFGMN